MIFLQLFWSFMKIGLTSFGGLSMVPLVAREMLSHGWMTAQEVSDIVGISEMTPGPLGLNCATFAGMRTAGLAGAVAANLGALVPTLTICAVAAMFFRRFRSSRAVRRVMFGVRPATVGMILGVTVGMAASNYAAPGGGISPASVVIGAVALVLLMKFRWSVPKTIAVSALMGLLFFGVMGL